jgi:tetratricopeptide (TPR) repeat protein
MIAMILNNQGNIYRLQGNVDKAHEKCMVGLMLRRKLERASAKPPTTVVRGIARSCYVLGLILREFGDNSGALRYFQEAEERYRQLDDQHGVANVLRWRAYIFSHVENYNYAIALAEESLQKLEQGVKSADLADTQDILGRIYRDSAMHDFRLAVEQDQVDQEAIERRNRDLELAEQFIRMGYDTATAVGDKYKEAESILSYVRLHYEREEYVETLKRYDEGMAICRKHEYNLLMSYYEFYAGRTHYMMAKASQDDAQKMEHYRHSFRHFAWRAAYASRCRAMELGMTLDSIGTHLTRLEDPELIVHFADYLMTLWEGEHSELRAYRLRERYTPLVELCEEIKRLFL